MPLGNQPAKKVAMQILVRLTEQIRNAVAQLVRVRLCDSSAVLPIELSSQMNMRLVCPRAAGPGCAQTCQSVSFCNSPSQQSGALSPCCPVLAEIQRNRSDSRSCKQSFACLSAPEQTGERVFDAAWYARLICKLGQSETPNHDLVTDVHLASIVWSEPWSPHQESIGA